MSTRCRLDLTGAITHLQSTLNRWREAQATVAESWGDQTAQKFHEENLRGSEEVLQRTMISLQEAAELVRSFEKKVFDTEDQSSW